MAERKQSGGTQRVRVPGAPEKPAGGLHDEPTDPGSPPSSFFRRPFVEVEIVQERGAGNVPQAMYRALEVWTQNRVYGMNLEMSCIEVRNRASGLPEPNHSVLGMKLVGGERRQGRRMEMCGPLPLPGTEAVFRKDGVKTRLSQTSMVERVVFRVRVAAFLADDKAPSFEQITSLYFQTEEARKKR